VTWNSWSGLWLSLMLFSSWWDFHFNNLGKPNYHCILGTWFFMNVCTLMFFHIFFLLNLIYFLVKLTKLFVFKFLIVYFITHMVASSTLCSGQFLDALAWI
jgi:hypothetical protein